MILLNCLEFIKDLLVEVAVLQRNYLAVLQKVLCYKIPQSETAYKLQFLAQSLKFKQQSKINRSDTTLKETGGPVMANLVSAVLLIHIQKSKVKTAKERDKTEHSGGGARRGKLQSTFFLPVFDPSWTYFYDMQLYLYDTQLYELML